MTSLTFDEEFSQLLKSEYSMIGYSLEEFSSMMEAYRTIMEKREPNAKTIINACDLVYDSIEI